MTPILAFDLGSHLGWAACNEHGLTLSGQVELKGGRYEGGGMRYLRAQKVINELIDTVKPQVVVFEEVRRHLSTDSAHVHGGLLAMLTAICEQRKIPYAGIPVATIKKIATGKGNADKAFMIAAAKRKWPDQDVATDNIADALWCLEAGKSIT